MATMHQAPDVDQLPCGLLVIGDDGRLRHANRQLAEIVGQRLQALVGAHVDELFTPASRMIYHSYLFPLLKLHGRVEEIEITLRGSDGLPVDALFNASRVVEVTPDAPGVPRATIHAVVLRLRERRRLEQQLLNAKRAAEQVPGLLYQLLRTADGWISMPYASEGIGPQYGVTPAQVQDDIKPLLRAVHPEDIAGLSLALQRSAETLSDFRSEHRSYAHDRVRWIESHATPQRLANGDTLWHGYSADITERREVEAARRERDAAERASRAKSDFLARVSHELRTPLNSILGFSRLLSLETRGQLEAAQRDKLRHIEQAGQNLLRLINEVLDISRVESGTIELAWGRVPLARVARDSLRLIEPQAHERGVVLSVDVPNDLLVHADEHRLQQALLNLLSNAVKYNRRGGTTALSVRRDGPMARIDVLDQGVGMTEAQIEQLFQPFNRLGAERSAAEGSGLGLVITRGLVELMAGTLEVISVPDQGSCFSIVLPLVNDVDAGETEFDEPSSRPAPLAPDDAIDATLGPRGCVLYVEDNPVNTLLMESLFELRRDWVLHCAATGAEAVERARELRPDLLLLDMHLPDIDGLQLLARLRTEPGLAATPAVAVSADALPEDIARARAAGFDDYWTKPLDIDRTLFALDNLLRSRDLA